MRQSICHVQKRETGHVTARKRIQAEETVNGF